MQVIILFGVLVCTYLMIMAKRISALICSFRYQSFFLFLATFTVAWHEQQTELFIVAILLFAIKVCAIPYFLYRIINRIKVNEDLGLFFLSTARVRSK